MDHDRAVGDYSQTDLVLFGESVIEFADISGDLAHVEVAHAFGLVTCFGPGDHQKRVENADETVGFLYNLFKRVALFVGRTACP